MNPLTERIFSNPIILRIIVDNIGVKDTENFILVLRTSHMIDKLFGIFLRKIRFDPLNFVTESLIESVNRSIFTKEEQDRIMNELQTYIKLNT